MTPREPRFPVGKLAAAVAAILLVAAPCFALRAHPREASPGQTVYLEPGAGVLDGDAPIRVTIGERHAPILRVTEGSLLQVMIPKLPPGRVTIAILSGEDVVDSGEIEITRSPLRRLFLVMDEGRITLERVRPYGGNYDPVAARGRRLSYDVFTEDGRLAYTGAILYPDKTQLEVFDDPQEGDIRRVEIDGPVSFIIKIPFQTGQTRVVFYEADATVDLRTRDGRNRRQRLNELTIPENAEEDIE